VPRDFQVSDRFFLSSNNSQTGSTISGDTSGTAVPVICNGLVGGEDDVVRLSSIEGESTGGKRFHGQSIHGNHLGRTGCQQILELIILQFSRMQAPERIWRHRATFNASAQDMAQDRASGRA